MEEVALMVTMRLDTFARHLSAIAADMPNLERRGMDDAGKMLRAAARGYIGEYQDAIRGSPAWAPLAERTIEDRIRLGFTPDDPLLRTGALRRSIDYTVRPRRLLLGSTSLIGLWQELGTVTIPPRPFLGRAMAEHGREATRVIFERVLRPLFTGRR